jgi:hypothetical protein
MMLPPKSRSLRSALDESKKNYLRPVAGSEAAKFNVDLLAKAEPVKLV